ncbi:MAG: alpha/beta fold hydrolase [Candidatus Solibacter usitatus]|nr:alpha/beta fold hydrolase [Candidatus Solibacter usitatus]
MRTLICIAIACAVPAFPQDRQRETLHHLLQVLRPSRPPANGRINAIDKTLEEWQRRTGELPPDFDKMPSIPGLPDPLLMRDGGRVATPQQWIKQKEYLRKQIEHWMFGRMPPAPGNVTEEITATRQEGRATIREVTLRFGPSHRATLRIELILPEGKGPFPVFLTNHARNRPWIYTAVRRGYAVCIYHATDPRYGNGDDSDAWIDVYPEFDFSCLARWAWAASRAIDYLYNVPEIDRAKIGLTGHSRNGKQALVAAAFDERIGAVIPSSGNSGECDPWRYTTEPFANESIELLAGGQSHWFHPRLRFFAGREDKLPVDQNTLLALVAPRGLMLYSGYAESAGNPFGFEQAYRDALRVYRFLGREQNIWLHLRDGEHETTAGDIENFIDFFDAVFGRRPRPKTETWIHGYSFDNWKKLSGENVNAAAHTARTFRIPSSADAFTAMRGALRKQLEWALGEEPPFLRNIRRNILPEETAGGDGWLAGLFHRPSSDRTVQAAIRQEGMEWKELPFGDGLKADLFLPAAKTTVKLPLVIWLHGYSYQYGWSIMSPWSSRGSEARLDQRPSFPSLVKRGFAVLAFDQIGFGTRVRDAKEFYQRYPRWSLMGKMTADTVAAIDAAAALDLIDPARIFLMGYSLGAKVGLMVTGMDSRVRGLAAVSGFDPLRLASADRGVEGIRHYSHLHGLMPRLGFFTGQEPRVPFDFDAALALAAPRSVLLVAPELDRYARIDDVRAEIAETRKAWDVLGAKEAFRFDTPADFNHFKRPLQERVFDWLNEAKGK